MFKLLTQVEALILRLFANWGVQLVLVLGLALLCYSPLTTSATQPTVWDKWAQTDDLRLAGQDIAADFTLHWVFTRMAMAGQGAQTYDLPAANAALQPYLNNINIHSPNLYPPPHMLLLSLFHTGDLLPDYLIYWALNVVVFAWGFFLLFGLSWPLLIALTAAPVSLCLAAGQNGLLVAGLLAGGLALLQKRPLATGLLWGTLVFKPHFFILLGPWLLATRQWRALWATALVAGAWVLASVAAYGVDIWLVYLTSLQQNYGNVLLGPELLVKYRWVSIFQSLYILGVPSAVALALHTLCALAAVGVAAYVALFYRASLASAAIAMAAMLLLTPYMYDYDLVAMQIPVLLMLRLSGYRGWAWAVVVVLSLLPWAYYPHHLEQMPLQLIPLGLWVCMLMLVQQVRSGLAPPLEQDVKRA